MKYDMKHTWYEKGAFANKKAKRFLNSEFDPRKVYKIAVIRHAALGDQVITRPFLVELRKFFPNAYLTLCAVSNYTYGMPDDLVDAVHIMHGSDKSGEINLREKIRNIKELPNQDIIFDLAATNRSYWMVALTKARLKIGFPYSAMLGRLLYDVALLRSDLTPEIESMLHALKFLGHQPKLPYEFAYPSNIKNINQKKPFIVYFNGASQESKRYPLGLMKELILKSLVELPDYQHVFLEGLSENEKADDLDDLKKFENFVVQPVMQLSELIDYLSESSLLLSTDTGVRNVAISTHTPTVGIFYSTVPFRYTPLFDNRHRIAMNADATMPTVEQVFTEISQAINTRK